MRGAEQNEKWVEMDGRSRDFFFYHEIQSRQKIDHAKSGTNEPHKYGLKVFQGSTVEQDVHFISVITTNST